MKTKDQIELPPSVAARRNLTARTAVASLAFATATIPAMAGSGSTTASKEDPTAMTSSTSVYTTPGFWERLWRMSGINFVTFVVIAYVIYGYQPQVGASTRALDAFYGGHRTRILIAAVFSGLVVLHIL